MAKRDYYEILRVSRDASDKDIKKAYRRLAMKYHPDRNPNDANAEEKFKEASEAAEILTDTEKRQTYDQFGHAAFEGGGASGGFRASGSFSSIFEDVFGDIFSSGHNRGSHQAHRGADLEYTLALNLEQAVKGASLNIKISTHVECGKCLGSGAQKGTAPINCVQCGGIGQITARQGFFSIQQTCPRCHGAGKVIADPCQKCHGQGRVEGNKTLAVKVPSGVDTGDRIRLANQGQVGTHGGPAGDLYVRVDIREHKIFTREGKHLYCEVPISFVEAALGGELEVPTLNGRINLKIPPETQTGKLFRLRGKGVNVSQVRGGGAGDLHCRIIVETPIGLSSKQKELLREFNGESSSKQSPKQTSWIGAVKNFFDAIKD